MMRSAGFSLIEILVVVTIGAVLAAMVVLRLGSDGGQDPTRQLERLAALIENQCEQAMFQARPRGIRVTHAGYDFWQLAGPAWQRLPAEGISRPRSWPVETRPELQLDGHAARIDADRLSPQIVCQPLGELTPFELQLRRDGQSWRLAGRADGALMATSGR
jgi:general secretion pathway protein H